jgi:predicted HTH transcriptional regulator
LIKLDELSGYREGNRLEAKKATGGLPKSLWETYSAFANTNGGIILLGAEESADKSLNAVELPNPEKNADFYDERGLVIRNNIDNMVFENPGSFRIELREALCGGVSSPRNTVILKMLNLLNIGERAGSGIPSICEAWSGVGFLEPLFTECIEINRSVLTLSLKKTSDIKQAIKASDKRQATKASDKRHAATAAKATPKIRKSDERKRGIHEYLSSRAESTSREVAEHLGISADRARVYLLECVSDGMVIAEGENRNRTYRLKAGG